MENFESCVRAIIKKGNQILVCWYKKEKFYFFPGGHINFGESIENTIKREFKEELGILVKNFSFIGVVENIYLFKKVKHREFNFVLK